MARIRLSTNEADGDLPPVCLVCGREAATTKARTMSWHPPWVAVTLLAGLLPYVIIAMILTKRARVQAPLCDAHRFHWGWRSLIVLGGFLGMLGALFACIAISDARRGMEWLWLLFLGYVVVWLIAAIGANFTAVRPASITPDEIILLGVSQEFVDAIYARDEEEDESRKRRRGKPHHEPIRDRDDNWAPRQRSRFDDAIRE